MHIEGNTKRASRWSRRGALKNFSGQRGLCITMLFFLLFPLFAEAQCSMCRAVLESEADGKVAEGINNGILYLMAIPYVIVGGLFYFVYRKMRN